MVKSEQFQNQTNLSLNTDSKTYQLCEYGQIMYISLANLSELQVSLSVKWG